MTNPSAAIVSTTLLKMASRTDLILATGYGTVVRERGDTRRQKMYPVVRFVSVDMIAMQVSLSQFRF